MTAGLSAVAYLAGYPDFVNRVEAAMISAAVSIGNENTHPGTEYERLRQGLATNVLNYRARFVDAFTWPVAANPVITVDSPDGDIQFSVNSVWDAVAGAGVPPTP
jgi:hypothetical protein